MGKQWLVFLIPVLLSGIISAAAVSTDVSTGITATSVVSTSGSATAAVAVTDTTQESVEAQVSQQTALDSSTVQQAVSSTPPMPPSGDVERPVISARYDNIACRTSFMASRLTAVQSVTKVDLSADATVLQNDLAKLKTLTTTSTTIKDFNAQTKVLHDDAVKSEQDRAAARNNISSRQKEQLSVSYTTDFRTMLTCERNARKEIFLATVSLYKARITKETDKIKALQKEEKNDKARMRLEKALTAVKAKEQQLTEKISAIGDSDNALKTLKTGADDVKATAAVSAGATASTGSPSATPVQSTS